MGDYLEKIVHRLDEGYKIGKVYFKSIPVCTFVQSSVQAVKILKTQDFRIEDIESNEIKIFPYGKSYLRCDCAGPFEGIMGAQMSNQFMVASILVNKVVDFKNYVNFNNPIVPDLARKILVEKDEEPKFWLST